MGEKKVLRVIPEGFLKVNSVLFYMDSLSLRIQIFINQGALYPYKFYDPQILKADEAVGNQIAGFPVLLHKKNRIFCTCSWINMFLIPMKALVLPGAKKRTGLFMFLVDQELLPDLMIKIEKSRRKENLTKPE